MSSGYYSTDAGKAKKAPGNCRNAGLFKKVFPIPAFYQDLKERN
jgi:hypothetical protein